nr:DUF6691 family protein [Prosthecomicrobium pneumaticum]
MFGLGLGVSGVTDPQKVLAFLDIGAIGRGGWDPSLFFVIAAAVIVAMAAVRYGHLRRAPVLAPSYSLPQRSEINSELIVGAAIFGVGWGLVGLCPGPAIAALAYALPKALLFIAAMAAGHLLVRAARGSRIPCQEPAE